MSAATRAAKDGTHARPSVIPAPEVRWVQGRWVLARDVAVHDPARGAKWVIPAGFTSDLASIPQVAQAIIPKDGVGVAGALSHDWLYRAGGVVPPDGRRAGRTYTRAEADRLFLDLMARDGVRWSRRWAAYLAVRAFGGFAWRTPSPEAVAVNGAMAPAAPADREAA